MSANSDDTRLSVAKENITGAVEGSFSRLPVTGNLDINKQVVTVKSGELNPDRQLTGLKVVNFTVEGGFDFDLQAEASDTILEGVFYSEFSGKGDEVSVGAQVVDGEFVVDVDLTSDLSPGDWIKTSGFVNQSNNGYFQIKSITAGLITLLIATSPLVNEASVQITIQQAAKLKNGTDQKLHTVQEDNSKHTEDRFKLIKGLLFEGLTMEFSRNDYVKCNAKVRAKDYSYNDNDSARGEVVHVNEAFSSAEIVKSVLASTDIDGVNDVQSISIDINNNARDRGKMSKQGATSFGESKFEVKISFSTYFDNKFFAKKLLANEDFNLYIVLRDPSGDYIIDFPRVQLEAGTSPVSGTGTDITFEGSAYALKDKVLGYTMSISKF